MYHGVAEVNRLSAQVLGFSQVLGIALHLESNGAIFNQTELLVLRCQITKAASCTVTGKNHFILKEHWNHVSYLERGIVFFFNSKTVRLQAAAIRWF